MCEIDSFSFFDYLLSPVMICDSTGKVIYKNLFAKKIIQSPRMNSSVFNHIMPDCRTDLRRSFRKGAFSALCTDNEFARYGFSYCLNSYVYLFFPNFSRIVYRIYKSYPENELGEYIVSAVDRMLTRDAPPKKRLTRKPLLENIYNALDFSFDNLVEVSRCGKSGLILADKIIEYLIEHVFEKYGYTIDYEVTGKAFGAIFPENPAIFVPSFFKMVCLFLEIFPVRSAKLRVEIEDLRINFILSLTDIETRVNSFDDMISASPELMLNFFIQDALCGYFGWEYSFSSQGGLNYSISVARLNEFSSRFHTQFPDIGNARELEDYTLLELFGEISDN